MSAHPQAGGEWDSVGARLSRLPHDKFVPALRLLTQASGQPEVRALLGQLAPQVIGYRARRLRLARVMCQPFEDLLYMRRRRHRPGGRIRWPAAKLAWRLVAAAIDEATLIRIAEDWAATTGVDRKARNAIGRKLWRIGSDVLAAIVAKTEGDKDYFQRTLGGDVEVRGELADIAGILSIAAQIERLKLELPGKPIDSLNERDMKVMMYRLATVKRDVPSAVPLLLLTISMRMRRPNDLLQALAEAGVFSREDQRRGGVVDHVEKQVIDDLDRSARDLRETNLLGGNPAATAVEAAVLLEKMESVTASLTVNRGGATDSRFDKMRAAVRNFVVEDVLAAADAEIGSVVGVPHGRVADAPPPTLDRLIAAENHARALRRSLRMAPSLKLEREIADKIDMLQARIADDTEEMLEAAVRSNSTLDIDAAEARLYTAVRMTELLIGPDQAHALYRRGRQRLGLHDRDSLPD